MLDYELVSINVCIIKEEVNLTTILTLGFEYILRVFISVDEGMNKGKFSECEVKIINLSGKRDEFFHHKFLNNVNVKFKCDNLMPIKNKNVMTFYN